MRGKWIVLMALMLGLPMVSFADDPVDEMLLLEPVQPDMALPGGATRFRKASADSARFLSFQHVYRIAFQEKTRRFLGGNFFKDYGSSIKGLGGWEDGDGIYTNYLLHPIQGATSGFLFIQRDTGDEALEFGKSGDYWRSRLKALAFAALYSTQFELGPLSEASIGNVGKTRGTMAFVDLIITPIGGFGWILAEDAIDRFVVRGLEKKLKRKGLIRFLRVALNPARSFANVMRLRLPWYRQGRELDKIFGEDPRGAERLQEFLRPDAGSEMGGQEFFEAHLVVFVPA